MNKTIKLLCTWAAGLLLAGCSSEADMSKLMDWQSNPDAVHFTASVNNATTRTNPAATNDAQTKFNEKDQVTVSNNGNQADYAYNGTSWAPAEADKYLLWDRSNLTFHCWYPAGGNNTATVGYLTENQSTEKLMAKSDYMNAETVLQTANDPLNFNLVRKTARLILKISGFTEQFESTATIKQVRIVSKASTAESETQTIEITPLTSGEGGIGTTYTALVAPGKVVAKFYFTDDMSDAKPITMTTNVTEAGSSYIYNLTVSKEKIKVTGITAGPWTAADGTTTGDIICYPYVTFKAEQPQTFEMTAINGYTISGLEYSVNFREWKTVVAYKEITFGGDKGDLRLRGTNTDGTASAFNRYSTITFTDKNVKVACTGDIRTLLNWKIYSTVDTQNARFCNLFNGCTALTSAPDLPATTLANACYYGMFINCTSLTSAPKLKATTLADKCYNRMFFNCTSLTSAPELKATTLATECCYDMFYGCTSLASAPNLLATKLANYCYWQMFYGCTSLTSAPELKATTLATECYYKMFNGCTSLTSAPELKATTLAPNCYSGMFRDCTKLSTVTMLTPSDQITNRRCYNWLYNAGTDGTVSSRTLIVTDEAAYNALVNTGYLPAIWKKGQCTVEYYTPKP